MASNLSRLKEIPEIVEIKKVDFSTVNKKEFHHNTYAFAKERSEKIHVYRMIYKSSGKNVVGFIVEPKKGKHLPCVIYNRGGSRDFGKIRNPRLFLEIGFYASQGYVVIATQYPGNDGGEGSDGWGDEEGLKSILDLKKILKKYGRADEKRIGMYGGSRGANMTYMCLRKVRWLKAAISVAGPSDNTYEKIDQFRPGFAKHLKSIFGSSNKQEVVKRSPIFWVDELSKKTPILIMHGTADWRVNPLDSLRLAQKLYEHKIPHRLIMYEGASHALNEVFFESRKQILSWLNRFVRDGEKLPNLKPHGD